MLQENYTTHRTVPCVLLIIIIIILSLNQIKVNAINTSFLVEDLTEKEKSNSISSINISLLESEPAKKAIKCFDVNEKGIIAVGMHLKDQQEICVYSSDGTFLYGFTFYCHGDFCVEWYNDLLNVCFVRSNVIITLDDSANIIEIGKIKDTIENNTLLNQFMYSTRRKIGCNEYYLNNNMGMFNVFATGYSQIIVRNTESGGSVIYEVNFAERIKTVILPILVITCCILCA